MNALRPVRLIGVAILLLSCDDRVEIADPRSDTGPTEGQKLTLELDYVTDEPPVTEYEGHTLASILRQAEIDLTVEVHAPGDVSIIDCFSVASIHEVISKTQDLGGDWYTHGLLLPKCCDGESHSYCGYHGAIWFQEPTNPLRRDFLVFPENMTSKEEKLLITIHEMGHVLNSHHCELGIKDFELAEVTKTHLREHRETNAEYLRPGSGQKWCGDLMADHLSLHSSCSGSDEESVDCPGSSGSCSTADACTSILELERRARRPRGVQLKVELDQRQYILGEPFRVNVVLRPDPLDPGAIKPRFMSEQSLDPSLGYLRIWFREWGSGAKHQPMGNLMYGEAALKPQRLDKEVRRLGYEVWYSVPLPTNRENAHDIEVVATYAGFVDSGEADSRLADLVAISKPVRIRLKPPTRPADEEAYDAITHPETRLFLLLRGGDHLQQGREMLEQIASGASVYKKYADHALAASSILPFVSFDRNTRTYNVRGPIVAKAESHLAELEPVGTPGGVLLPPSYQQSVTAMRKRLLPP